MENIPSGVNVATGPAFKSRTIFIIGPQWKGKHHIRLAFKYPAAVGVSPEVLRALDALQTADSTGFGHGFMIFNAMDEFTNSV